MRVALLSHQWPGARMGGIGSAVRHTAAALAGAGHDVHVFTPTLPPDARANVPPTVRVHEAPTLAERVTAATLPPDLAATVNAGGEAAYRLAIGWLLCDALVAEHARQPFDIVESPEVEALALPLLLRPDFAPPVVTHLHCATAIAHFGNNAVPTDADHLINAMEFAAIALADAVCAPTQKVVDLTRQFVRIDADVTIIPHPVSPPTRPREWSEEQSGEPTDGAILFFGRIERLKGVEPLARALNVFLPRNPNARFRFIGPDTATAPGGRSMLQHLQQILAPAVSDRVDFPGEMSQALLQRELRGASFCVLPSLFENFSMAVCEAMAAGRAVVVADGTGSPEVTADAGLIARRDDPTDLAAQMERLFRDRTLRRSLGDRGRARVETALAPARVATDRVAFYERTIDAQAATARPPVAEALAALPPESQAAFLRSLVALTGTLTRVAAAAPQTPGRRLLAIMQRLAGEAGRPSQVVLYGAGKHTQRLLTERALWESAGHRVVGILDDHPRFAADPTFLGLPVRSVAAACAALSTDQSHPPVVLSTDTYQDLFFAQTKPLRDAGVLVVRLYD